MKVEFEIHDELTPLSGVAVLHCFTEDGNVAYVCSQYGDLRPTEATGLLLSALDDTRADFLGGRRYFLDRGDEDR